MNTDLILQLEKLSPTEGIWEKDMWNYLRIKGKIAFEPHGTNPNTYNDDIDLITLAPAMRLEILAMAKEIEELRNEILKLKRFNSTKKILGYKPKPNIQMVTACGRFELLSNFNDSCKNCGKSKYLHVTPQPK